GHAARGGEQNQDQKAEYQSSHQPTPRGWFWLGGQRSLVLHGRFLCIDRLAGFELLVVLLGRVSSSEGKRDNSQCPHQADQEARQVFSCRTSVARGMLRGPRPGTLKVTGRILCHKRADKRLPPHRHVRVM